MSWKAIFFDLDGTLVQTSSEIAAATNDTLLYLGLPEVSLAQVTNWIGQGTRELLILALAEVTRQSQAQVRHGAGLSDALPIFDRYYQQRCGTLSVLYPHVREVLHALRKRACKLAVVTNKESRYTDTVLKMHGLTDLFDMVVSGDTFSSRKPNPVGVLHGLRLWGVDASEGLFVGDSSIDAATGRNAGLRVWLLPYGYNMGQPVEDCQPDRVIEDLSQLL